jgi:hypothetical protein
MRKPARPPKPDFDLVYGRLVRTDDRVAYIRYLAEQEGMTARQIANECGFGDAGTTRIQGIVQREEIRCKNTGRARSRRDLLVTVGDEALAMLNKLAEAMGCRPKDIAARLIEAGVAQGETFCKNMLDDGAAI